MLCQTQLMMTMTYAVGGLPDSIGSVDHDTMPIRCHYDRKSDRNKCDTVLESAEDAWLAQVDGVGFPAPAEDRDGILDIYIFNYSHGGAYTYCDEWRDPKPGDGFTGCPAYIALARNIPQDEIPGYIAHEFNHALQWAMDWNEWTWPVWEGVATAAEGWTYKGMHPTNDWVADFQVAPWMGLMGYGNYLWDRYELWSYYEYGSALWILHMDHVYGKGDGTVGGRDFWLNLAQEGPYNSVTWVDSMEHITGDWQAALMDFSVERTKVGTTNTPSWADWAETNTQLAVELSADAGSLPVALVPEVAPFATGSVYAEVTGVEKGATLSISVDAATESEWGILVVQGTDEDWVQGPTMEWQSNGEDMLIGVVNLDQSSYAETGDTAELGQSQVDITLNLALVDDKKEPKDTGDTGVIDEPKDTGSPADPGNTDKDNAEKKGGCTVVAPTTGLLWVLSMVGLARRRD